MAPAATANAPVPSATPHPAPDRRRVRALPLLIALAAPLAPAGCGGPSSTEPAYPSLATVPPRPRLSYEVEQRRAVEGELVRDRANAARVVPEIDYELGRAPAPPPPTAATPELPPTEAAKAEPPRPSGGPGDSPEVEAYVAEAMARAEDEGELKDLMRRLERPAIPTAERPGEGDAPPPRQPSIAGALGLEVLPPPAGEGPAAAPEPAAGPRAGAERPRSEALDRFGGHLGGVLGLDDAPAAAVAAAPPAGVGNAPASSGADAPGVVARVAFGAGDSGLPDGAEATLSRALDEARRRGAGLRIAAGGPDGTLRAGRARAVAAALVRLGAETGSLELAGGGGAEDGEVRVSLARRS